MLTFPCFVEEPWRVRLAASLLRLRIRACDARQRQRTGTVQVSSVRPRSEADIIVNAAQHINSLRSDDACFRTLVPVLALNGHGRHADLRIMSVFPCVARGFKAWFLSGSQGATGGDHRLLTPVRGHLGDTPGAPVMRRPGLCRRGAVVRPSTFRRGVRRVVADRACVVRRCPIAAASRWLLWLLSAGALARGRCGCEEKDPPVDRPTTPSWSSAVSGTLRASLRRTTQAPPTPRSARPSVPR
jgi:hypothetical protein